jgi:hypothetical protein
MVVAANFTAWAEKRGATILTGAAVLPFVHLTCQPFLLGR